MAKSKEEPNNWVELIQNVNHDRKHLPWDPEKVQPVQRVSLYHVSS
jgi:hypothetical protein